MVVGAVVGAGVTIVGGALVNEVVCGDSRPGTVVGIVVSTTTCGGSAARLSNAWRSDTRRGMIPIGYPAGVGQPTACAGWLLRTRAATSRQPNRRSASQRLPELRPCQERSATTSQALRRRAAGASLIGPIGARPSDYPVSVALEPRSQSIQRPKPSVPSAPMSGARRARLSWQWSLEQRTVRLVVEAGVGCKAVPKCLKRSRGRPPATLPRERRRDVVRVGGR